MHIFIIIVLIVAAVVFACGAIVSAGLRDKLIGWGLFFLTLAFLLPQIVPA